MANENDEQSVDTVLNKPDVETLTGDEYLYIIQGTGSNRDKKGTLNKIKQWLRTVFEYIELTAAATGYLGKFLVKAQDSGDNGSYLPYMYLGFDNGSATSERALKVEFGSSPSSVNPVITFDGRMTFQTKDGQGDVTDSTTVYPHQVHTPLISSATSFVSNAERYRITPPNLELMASYNPGSGVLYKSVSFEWVAEYYKWRGNIDGDLDIKGRMSLGVNGLGEILNGSAIKSIIARDSNLDLTANHFSGVPNGFVLIVVNVGSSDIDVTYKSGGILRISPGILNVFVNISGVWYH